LSGDKNGLHNEGRFQVTRLSVNKQRNQNDDRDRDAEEKQQE